MNETKQQSTRNISQSTNLPTHSANSNGLPSSCAASTSAQINHHTFTTPTKNDNLKSQTSQPQTPQFKTVQLIPSSNHLVSAPQGNCVVVQQVSNSNHSLNFQHLSSPEHSQNQSGQTIYRQKNQAFVNSRPQPVNQSNANAGNQNGDGNGTNIQQSQLSTRYVHQLQDGRQLQMIQIPNNAQYVQLSNAPGQNGQPSQIMTYVHPQQQQFVARNGNQTQNVIIASQAQDGSRTLQTVPAQIHTIQHTVSPQNASFHLTKSSLKNPLNPSTQPQQQQQQQQNASQNRRPEFVHPQNNGTQNATQNQPQNQNNSDGQNSQLNPQIIESPKVRPKAKTTPNKAKPKIMKSSPQTQQITNHVGQPTATIQQIALPVNAQIRAPNPNIKGKEKSAAPQVRTVASFVQIQPPSTPTSQQQPQNSQVMNQENSQKVQQSQIVQQQVSTNAVVQTVQKNVQITQQIVQKTESQQQTQQGPQVSTNQQNQTIIVQQSQTQVSTTLSSQTTVQTASQVVTTAKIPAIPTIVKARTVVPQLKPSTAADATSPIPNDPYSGALSKLNLDLTGGDPKDSYRVLKKHFKFLVYENECYQGQLRDSHQRLLKLERDNNYLMDRLLKYETLSDSDGDESDSSVKTIEDKVLTQKTTKKRPAARKDSSAPPRKKANVSNKANSSNVNTTTATPLPKVNPPTSKAPASIPPPPKSVVKPIVVKDSPGSSKPSTSSTSSSAAIPQSNSNTSIQSTSSSTLSVFQANMPLPSIYKPFPPSNTSTVSTPSTPTTDNSFVTPALPKTNGPVVAKKPVLVPPKPAPPKAKVIIADLPKTDIRSKPQSSPTTSATSSATDKDIPEPKVFTVVSRAPIPPRNPTPQSNATVTYSTLKPNAMIPRPMGQMPTQNRMHSTRPKIQIIQPPPMNPSSTTTPPQYNIQQNAKPRPQLKDISIIKKESPSKPNS